MKNKMDLEKNILESYIDLFQRSETKNEFFTFVPSFYQQLRDYRKERPIEADRIKARYLFIRFWKRENSYIRYTSKR